MREITLKEYFENRLTTEQLSADLRNSQRISGPDSKAVYIDQLEDEEFLIEKQHLIKLCNDVIAKKLSPLDLNTIAFAIMGSDCFFWDGDTESGKIISEVVFEWDCPEIGHDITIKNIKLWKEYLLTGEYRLDKNELKLKSRSKGQGLELYRSIDEILWNDWDPIGINDIAPRDEYQGYTPEIFKLKNSGADLETISNRLNEISIERMGLAGNINHCRIVAKKIIELN